MVGLYLVNRDPETREESRTLCDSIEGIIQRCDMMEEGPNEWCTELHLYDARETYSSNRLFPVRAGDRVRLHLMMIQQSGGKAVANSFIEGVEIMDAQGNYSTRIRRDHHSWEDELEEPLEP